jgi:hypothetical protein
MAQATVEYVEVIKPVENIVLTLNPEEANALFSVLCTIAVKGVGKTTYKIFSALTETKSVEITPLKPFVPNRNFGVDLVEFKEYDGTNY